MQLIAEFIHPSVQLHVNRIESKLFRRQAARGIVLRDMAILLLFTERYNDFSFPGGGVDAGEDLTIALRRELAEETGARDIEVHDCVGYIEEYRPYYKSEFDAMHMTSHFFHCSVAQELQAPTMEHYEINNGMRPRWVNIHHAIAHNQAVINRQETTMGLSIARETLMLEKVAADFF